MRFYRNFVSSAFNLARVQRDPKIVAESAKGAADEGIQIKKLKLNDRELAQTVTLIRSKRKLKRDEQIIVEGNVLIREAIQAKIKLNKLIFSDPSRIADITHVLPHHQQIASVEFLKVPETDLTFYSVLQTCPGVIGIFDKPKEIEERENCYPIEIIADNCREPNNCSIVRVCNALPAKRLLLVKGNVDVWDTKSIRASMGSIFNFPTKCQLTWEEVDKLTATDSLVLIADSNTHRYNAESVVDYDALPDDILHNRPISVIIGGETLGISSDAVQFAKMRDWRCIKIPMDPAVNSLNISNALAIVLFELRRRLNKS